jgi:hypothetical protein
MNRMSRRDLMIAAAGCAVTPLSLNRVSAAEIKVDLSQERVGQPPATFQPIVGTWRVVQDGPEKVIMVDGQPWKAAQSNRTSLLAERARAFYNASQEDFIDNVKQFAYYPIATLNGVDNFSNGLISLKFKTIAGDLDRCSGILFKGASCAQRAESGCSADLPYSRGAGLRIVLGRLVLEIRKKDGKEHRCFSVVENKRVGRGRVVQRHVLYLGEINDTQELVWRKSIAVLEAGAAQPQTLSLFPEDRCAGSCRTARLSA